MNWKLCLAVLTCNVLFMSSSYTMIIPFLPVYLTKELGVIPAEIHLWSGIIFSASFIVSSVMAPIWGRMADNRGKRIMALRASFLLSISYFLGGIVTTPIQLTCVRCPPIPRICIRTVAHEFSHHDLLCPYRENRLLPRHYARRFDGRQCNRPSVRRRTFRDFRHAYLLFYSYRRLIF